MKLIMIGTGAMSSWKLALIGISALVCDMSLKSSRFWPLWVGLFVFFLWPINAIASEINLERLADAIYLAEGGAKTRHPYGILKKYKTTTPRQACLNTIRHRMKDWEAEKKPGEFISYLQKTYAPIGSTNDQNGLNKNWVSNVRYFYQRAQAISNRKARLS